jgi:tetratricopeptide (TPR) repeat protein
LWRLHGRLASARGDQSRAIGLLVRALKHAETAHDSTAIGLAHYELGQCYRQVGDLAILREHITKAASALHAAGDRRHLALVHSLSGVSLAQLGRNEEAMAALRQAERLAAMVQADDVLAIVCGNQANVTMLQHHYEQALALAERSVALHEAHGSGHGLAVALATLGQICVRLGDLGRAEEALHRALDVRSPIQFHETTGAVFDTLAQIHLIRGRYDTASDFLQRAGDAYGAYGRPDQQVVRMVGAVLGARLALRRATLDEAVARADEIVQAGAPPFDSLQATLIAVEALTAANRLEEAEQRLAVAGRCARPADRSRGVGRIPPAARRGAGEVWKARPTRTTTSRRARRCWTCWASATRRRSVTWPSAGSSPKPARGRWPSGTSIGRSRFSRSSGRNADLEDTHAAQALLTSIGTGQYVISPADADDAIVRRIVDAAALPELLGRETAAALLEAAAADCSVVFVELGRWRCARDRLRRLRNRRARTIARAASHGNAYGRGTVFVEPLGRDDEGPRFGLVASPRPIGHPVMRRLRMIAAVAARASRCAPRATATPR